MIIVEVRKRLNLVKEFTEEAQFSLWQIAHVIDVEELFPHDLKLTVSQSTQTIYYSSKPL